MEQFAVIRTFLRAVGRRLRRRDAAYIALYVGAALAAAGLLLPVLALWGGAPVLRWLGIGLATGLIGVLIAYGFVVPRRRWARHTSVARFVGTRVEPLASDLLSSVELGESVDDRYSPELIGALVQSTAQKIELLEPGWVVERRVLHKPAWLLLATATATLAFALAAPDTFGAGWRALVTNPLPGPFDGAEMESAPIVGDVVIHLEFPAYTQRPAVSLPAAAGDFRAMPGTVASIRTTVLDDVVAAEIVFGDNRESTPLAVSGRELSGAITVADSDSYRFLIETPDGTRRVEAIAHTIEVQTDQEPKVELHAPADELDVTSRKRIELAYIASDDFGITGAELVWGEGRSERHMPVPVPEPGRRSSQSKFLWDLADISLTPGVRIPYHVEVSDNDTISGPNIGRSRTYYLRVFSERERHESLIARQREMFENMVKNLGGRLVVEVADARAHTTLNKETDALVVELGTVIAAVEKHDMTDAKLVETLGEIRSRLDKLTRREHKLLSRKASLAASDKAMVAELEDDVVLLADWLDRQQMENLLALTDEVKTHQERIKKLLEEYKRTGSEEILAELEREIRALETALAQLAESRMKVPEDVLDQFVNADAIPGDEVNDCVGEVRKLIAEGKVDEAAEKMEECSESLNQSQQALENALDRLRGEKFSEEQKKLDELLSDAADLAKDQQEIADEAAEVYDRYKQRAQEMMRDKADETKNSVQKTLDALKKRLGKIPESGLTPFSKEELDVIDKRLKNLEEMLDDGDIAEALSMARQTEASLEMMEAELDANMEEGAQWNKRTPEAHRQVRKAQPLAKKLVKELESAAPSPQEILSKRDRKKLDKLRRRQQAAAARAQKLIKKAQADGQKLPGDAGQKLQDQVGEAAGHMKKAEQRMKVKDPSGARHEAAEAASKLREARKQAQRAARKAQQDGRTGLRDEPVRIPGAEEYQAPKEFREDILDAMKKDAPSGFEDMVRRYYEELIR